MTAPDYEAMAREVFQVAISCEGPGHEPIAAALREADAAALERAAQVAETGSSAASHYGDSQIAARIRALAQPAPGGGEPDARCGYTMTVRLPDLVPLECELPPSHTGPHRNDIAEWTSPPSALAQPSPAPPPTSAVDPRWLRNQFEKCAELFDRALASPAAEKRAESEEAVCAGSGWSATDRQGGWDDICTAFDGECGVCHLRIRVDNTGRVVTHAAPDPKADPHASAEEALPQTIAVSTSLGHVMVSRLGRKTREFMREPERSWYAGVRLPSDESTCLSKAEARELAHALLIVIGDIIYSADGPTVAGVFQAKADPRELPGPILEALKTYAGEHDSGARGVFGRKCACGTCETTAPYLAKLAARAGRAP